MSEHRQSDDQDPSQRILELFKAMDQRDERDASKAMLELRDVLKSVDLNFRMLTDQFAANDILAPSRVVTMMAMMDSEHEGEALQTFAALRKILKQSGLTFEEIIAALDRKGNERQAADETTQMLEAYRQANEELTDICARLLKENADLRDSATKAQEERLEVKGSSPNVAGHHAQSAGMQQSHAAFNTSRPWQGSIVCLDDDDVRAIHLFSPYKDTGPSIADRGRRYKAKRFIISSQSAFGEIVDVENGTDRFRIRAPKQCRREGSLLVPTTLLGAFKYRRFVHMHRMLGLIMDGSQCEAEGPVVAGHDGHYYYMKVPSPLRPRYFFMEPKIFDRLYEPA